MANMKDEQEYNEKDEKIRKYFFTFIGCFIGFVVLVFITNLEPKIFFTGFILLIVSFVGIIIYGFYVAQKPDSKHKIIVAQGIADLKDLKEGDDDQKYTEQDLLDILNAIADKKSTPIVKNKSSIFDDMDDRNRRLQTSDICFGTNFRSAGWNKHG